MSEDNLLNIDHLNIPIKAKELSLLGSIKRDRGKYYRMSGGDLLDYAITYLLDREYSSCLEYLDLAYRINPAFTEIRDRIIKYIEESKE